MLATLRARQIHEKTRKASSGERRRLASLSGKQASLPASVNPAARRNESVLPRRPDKMSAKSRSQDGHANSLLNLQVRARLHVIGARL